MAEIKDICKKNEDIIIKEYIDDGWSGETLARPGLDELRDDAGKGIWSNLYILCPDRLGRDHIDQGIVLRELKRQGIQVVFKDAPLTEDNKLQKDIESLLAEYENKQRRERVRRGKLHHVQRGENRAISCPFWL